jgi:hypothetical protein
MERMQLPGKYGNGFGRNYNRGRGWIISASAL